MHPVHTARINCPYCGEPLVLTFEPIGEAQQYIEDCQVCCQPMVCLISDDGNGKAQLVVQAEDDCW
jgi:hypothetical protein